MKKFNVYAPSEEIIIRRLSGGNIQKVIMGRAFVNPIKLLVTHNPTSGLDVSTVEFILKNSLKQEVVEVQFYGLEKILMS